MVVAAHEKAVFGEIQFLACFFFGELDVAGVTKVLEDSRTMRLRLCGSAAFFSLDAFVHFFQVEEAIIFLDVILHLALNSYEANRRKVNHAIFFFVERTRNTEFLGDFVLLSRHLDPNVRLMDGVTIHVYLYFGLEEIAIGFIADRLSFNSIFMFDFLYLQDLLQFFKSNLTLFF